MKVKNILAIQLSIGDVIVGIGKVRSITRQSKKLVVELTTDSIVEFNINDTCEIFTMEL